MIIGIKKLFITLLNLLKCLHISTDPPANTFYWEITSDGLWLGTGRRTNGFRLNYSVILKSATVRPIDSLVLKSQLDEYITTIDSIVFTTMEPIPNTPPEAWTVNTSFAYTDDHVLSSQATKLLVGKIFNQPKEALLLESSRTNTTITHYTPIEAGERIDNYEVGKPVFLLGHGFKHAGNQWLSSTADDSTDCISDAYINGTLKEYIRLITLIDVKNNSITVATHGDMLFKVDDANIYQIADVVLCEGRIVDEDYSITLRIQWSIAGKITSMINEHVVSLFKY